MSIIRGEQSRGRTGKGDHEVEGNEHETLHVVRLAILDEEVDEQHRDKEDDRFEVSEKEGEVVVGNPADDNQKRNNKGGNLL